MRHHLNQPDSKFVHTPIYFDKYTDISILRYCLGATMYMPGTRNFHEAILSKKYPGLTSFVLCFEDACPADKVPEAEDNVIRLLDSLSDDIENGVIKKEEIPLLIIRVRNIDQFKKFSERLTKRHV